MGARVNLMCRMAGALVFLLAVANGTTVAQTLQHAADHGSLLPRDAAVVFSFQGSEKTQSAYEQTASFRAFSETGVFGIWSDLTRQIPWDAISEGSESDVTFEQVQFVFGHLARNGGAVAVCVPEGRDADGSGVNSHVVLVVEKGAVFAEEFADWVRKVRAKNESTGEPDDVASGAVEGLALKEGTSDFVEETLIGGRRVFLAADESDPDSDDDTPALAWWTHGESLLLCVGQVDLETMVPALHDQTLTLAGNRNWTESLPAVESRVAGPRSEFVETVRVWFDVQTLIDRFGDDIPIPIEKSLSGPIQLAAAEAGEDGTPVVQATQYVGTMTDLMRRTGLSEMKAVSCRLGYQDNYLKTHWTVLTGDRRGGLLELCDQQPVSLEDLPPLPVGTTSFTLSSIDLAKAGRVLAAVGMRLIPFLPEEDRASVIKWKRSMTDTNGFDLQRDVLSNLDNVVCSFNDGNQEVLGWGQSTFAIRIRNRELLQQGIDRLVEKVNARNAAAGGGEGGNGVAADVDVEVAFPDAETEAGAVQVAAAEVENANAATGESDLSDIHVKAVERNGCSFYVVAWPKQMITPSFAICGEWLVIGLQPQTVQAFALRQTGQLPVFDTSRLGEEATAEIPDEFTSLSWSDPRPSVRLLLSSAPWLIDLSRTSLAELFDINGADAGTAAFSSLSVPPVELVLQPLFPNVTVTNVTPDRVTTVSSSSTRADSAAFWFVGGYTAMSAFSVVLDGLSVNLF